MEQPDFYIDPKMKIMLDKFKHLINSSDEDSVIIVDGPERSGKSVLAMQMAKYVDPSFDLNRVCMKGEEFLTAINKASKGQAIIFDEAFNGLAGRNALSALNKTLVGKMQEMGQKNLFIIIVLPSFFMLEKYVALFRTRVLIHVYRNKGNRGYWCAYNQKNKKILYLVGRKLMSYSKPKIVHNKGRFYGKYVVDEQAYREKKKVALEESVTDDKPLTRMQSRHQAQRDILLRYFVKSNTLSLREAEKRLNLMGFLGNMALSHTQIGDIIEKGGTSDDL